MRERDRPEFEEGFGHPLIGQHVFKGGHLFPRKFQVKVFCQLLAHALARVLQDIPPQLDAE
jgi:hypothetical protein